MPKSLTDDGFPASTNVIYAKSTTFKAWRAALCWSAAAYRRRAAPPIFPQQGILPRERTRVWACSRPITSAKSLRYRFFKADHDLEFLSKELSYKARILSVIRPTTYHHVTPEPAASCNLPDFRTTHFNITVCSRIFIDKCFLTLKKTQGYTYP